MDHPHRVLGEQPSDAAENVHRGRCGRIESFGNGVGFEPYQEILGEILQALSRYILEAAIDGESFRARGEIFFLDHNVAYINDS